MTYITPARGIRKSSAIITAAAPATPENLYLLSVAGTVTRSVILRKIWAWSAVGASITQIGQGLGIGFAAIIPPFLVLNGVENIWDENDIPEVEIVANLTVQSVLAGIMIMVEVEEIGN